MRVVSSDSVRLADNVYQVITLVKVRFILELVNEYQSESMHVQAYCTNAVIVHPPYPTGRNPFLAPLSRSQNPDVQQVFMWIIYRAGHNIAEIKNKESSTAHLERRESMRSSKASTC